jgi:hypothetical protein
MEFAADPKKPVIENTIERRSTDRGSNAIEPNAAAAIVTKIMDGQRIDQREMITPKHKLPRPAKM